MSHIINNFPHRLGMNCLSTSVRDMLDYNGYSYSEDFCMGLSGAFSFWYSKCDQFMQATGLGNNIFDELCAVTKIQHQFLTFENNDEAWEAAHQYIDHDIPVIFDVELAAYAGKIDAVSSNSKVEKKMMSVFDAVSFRVGGHVTTCIGYDDTHACLVENMFYKPVKVPLSSLACARAGKDVTFVPPGNGMHVFFFPEKLPPLDELIHAAIKRVIYNMKLSYSKPAYYYGSLSYDKSGLKGIDSFFDEINGILTTKSEVGLKQVLALVQILNRWGGNEVNRAAYSRFLKEAAKVTSNEYLIKASDSYVIASKEWKLFLRKLDAYLSDSEQGDISFVQTFRDSIMEAETKAVDYLCSGAGVKVL